jgi:hypothetical protein
MKPHLVVLVIAFIASFLAIGLPYWQIPYAKAQLPSTLYGFGLVVLFVAAAACRLVPPTHFLLAALVGAAAPAAVIARVMYETSADPTSHNLWPFEVVIAALVGFCVSLIGSLLGGLLKPLVRPT